MYKVIIKNGDTETTIHDPQNKKFIFNKKVIQELNMSDYFSFSVDNAFDKSLIKAYSTIIIVYDESDIVFYGRALTDEADLYNTNTIECDGALSYLYDTYYPPYEFAGTPKQMFEELIKNHNANVEEKKKFKIGEVSVTDPNDYLPRSSKNYSKTLDVIKKKLISSLGGYIRVKYNGDTNTIDYVDSLQHVAAQTIETAKNLLDINIKTDESEIITVLIPFGATDDETGKTLDITSVNNGKDYIENKEAINKYGRICGTVKFDNVTVASNLLKKAESYLLEKSSPITTITLNAIDLHMIDKSVEKFKLGDWIRVIIPTHGINDNFLLSKIEYDLDNPENSKITLGTVEIGLTDTNTTIVETVSDEVNKVLSNLTAINVKVTGKLDVNVFEAFKATIDDLDVGNLAAKVATIETSYVNKQYVNENYVGIQYANQTYAVKSDIKDLTADVAKINTLLSGSVTAGSTQTIVLNAENTTIANALIKSANIESVNAGIINSGTLNTNLVQIQSQDGGVKINGNTQQFLDKNNKVRVQIGRDAQNNFNFLVVGEDGKTAIFNENGITKNAVPNGLIVDQMVSDGANIQGNKINITSLITEINGNSTMIESSHIKYDGKSLDVAFNSMQTSVSTVTKTITDNKSKWDTASTNASNAVTTANQAKSTAESANTNASNALNKASSVETRANSGEFDGRGVGTTSIAYQASSNGTVAPTGAWTSTIPSVPAGQYLWTRTVIMYTDKTTDYIYTVAKMGANGTNGSKGDKGDTGATGNGISSITNYYLASASASGVTVSTSGWTTTPQSVSTSKKYHWSYQIIAYTNGNKTTTTPAIIGVYGDTGAQGAQGATGKGIKSVTPQYYLSTSNTTQSGGSWKTTQDTWSSGKYYWVRDSIVWSDNTTTYTTPTLDVGLNTANANALNAITKVTTVEETVKTQSTQITTAQGQISTLITDVTQAKKDITATKGDVTTAKANITTLTNNYSSIKQTVDGLNSTVGSHTSQLTTIKGTADSALSLINNLSIGGRNYIVLGKITSYTPYNTAPTVSGNVLTSTWNASYTGITFTIAISGFSPKNKVYTLSGYLKVNGAIPTAKYFIDKASTYGSSLQRNEYDPKTGYFVITQTYSGSSNWILHGSTTRKSGSTDVVTIEKLKFEEGNKATDWTPAPEDVTSSIATVDGRVTTEIKKVTDKQSVFENTINGIASRVSSTETNITTVTKTVEDTKNLATNAKTIADSASTNASSAKTVADQAKTSASSAVTTANTAKTTADTAKSTADSAKTTATTASTNASNAVTTANGAKSIADTAKTLADSKSKTFTTTPTTPYKIGDLWTQGASGVIMRCKTARASGAYVASDWEKADKYTDDTTANKVRTDLTATIKTVTDKQATFETTLNGITSRVSQTETKVTTVTNTVNGNKANWDKASTALDNANNAKAYTDAVKNNFGYLYKTSIIINGESNKYYPVVLRGGNQSVMRELLIFRSFGEQAPNDWNTSTHKGGLTLKIKCNYGRWGGIDYSWYIHDFEQMYAPTFGGKAGNISGMFFYIFLRGGGTTGAKYYIYSDQPLVNEYMGGSSPQICYNSDQIGYSIGNGTVQSPQYRFNAPAPITSQDTETIKKKKYATLAEMNYTELTSTKSTVATHTTQLNNITSRVSTTETNITNINGNITSLTTRMSTAEQKVTDSAIVATVTKSSNWSTLNAKATDAQTKANNLVDLTTIKDTRSANNDPQWYITNYARKTVKEFKECTAIGISGEGTYGTLVTEISWDNSSGGYPNQLFYPNTSQNIYRRVGTSATAWGAWTKVAGTHNAISIINQTAEEVKIQASKISLEGVVTANQYFKINTDGSMIATAGKIGKFNITSSYIDTGSGATNAGFGGNQAFWAGSESSNSAPFHVSYDGSLYASRATITGGVVEMSSKRTVSVTNADADKIMNYIVGRGTLTDAEKNKFDINQDGRVTAVDYTLCRQIANGNLSGNITDFIKMNSNSKTRIEVGSSISSNMSSIISGGSISTNYLDAVFINLRDTEITPNGITYDKSSSKNMGIGFGTYNDNYLILDMHYDDGNSRYNILSYNTQDFITEIGSYNKVVYSSGCLCNNYFALQNAEWIGFYNGGGIGGWRKAWMGHDGGTAFNIRNDAGEDFIFTTTQGWLRAYATNGDGCFNFRTDLSTFWFAQKVSVAGLINRSREKYKTNIVEFDNALKLINDSKVYEYNLKEELQKGTKQQHYGFIIERETPQEIVNGDGVDVYSLASINWQGTKELAHITNVRLTKHDQEIQELRNENARLKQELKNTQAKLDAFISGNFEFKTVTREVV